MITTKSGTHEPQAISKLQSDQFPILGVNKNDRIVLFTGPRSGTLIAKGSDTYDVGHVDNTWFAEYYAIYHGEVTLSNSKWKPR